MVNGRRPPRRPPCERSLAARASSRPKAAILVGYDGPVPCVEPEEIRPMARRPRSRYQRERSHRFWVGLFKFLVFLGIVGATAYYAYGVGRELSQDEIGDLQEALTDASTTAQEARARSEELQTQLDTTTERAEEYRRLYEETAPEEVRGIIAAARERLKAGLSPQRLEFIVSQASPPRNCSQAETRRFIAKTANYDGPNTWVRFNDVMTVTAAGEGANDGREEWYDPSKPVSVTFSALGAGEKTVEGMLPLQYSMIFKGKEYRFTVSPGARSFVEVTADWCDYRRD